MLAVVACLLIAEPAPAWRSAICNDRPVRWVWPQVPIAVMPCSAPPGSHRSNDFLATMAGWNSVPGARIRFEPEVGAPTCRIEVNGRSEVGYIAPENLDGARGVTRIIYNVGCVAMFHVESMPEIQVIAETDIAIAAFDHDVSGPPRNCDRIERTTPLRRALLLHELGHAFGLRHEDDEMAVMNTGSSGGRYCGPRAMEPHPDDRTGVRVMYPDPEAEPVRDVAALPFELTEPNYTRPVVRAGHYGVCPNEPLDLRWSVANLGTVDARTQIRWYLSDNDVISSRDIHVATSDPVVVPAGEVHTASSRVIVPPLPRRANGQSGPWWVGYVVDPDGPGFELPATNDWAYTQLRVSARSPEECAAR